MIMTEIEGETEIEIAIVIGNEVDQLYFLPPLPIQQHSQQVLILLQLCLQ
jgi:hypothetical protein